MRKEKNSFLFFLVYVKINLQGDCYMEKFRPDIYQHSMKDIHFNKLKDAGIQVLLIDVDNTILKYKKLELEEDLNKLLLALKSQFTVILFSNGSHAKVKRIASTLDIPFIARAMKPLQIGFKKILKRYKVDPAFVAIIGDQLLTDIRGGNHAEVTTILVDPLSSEEMFYTKMQRKRENRIIKKMSASGLFFKERYYE